jgi:bifunctional non-homologous end joining protein LigD
LAQASHGRMIVDGEMCILNEMGRSDFDALHDRARKRRLAPGDLLVTFRVFDLLAYEEQNIMQRPLIARKAALAEVLSPGLSNVLYAGHISAADVEEPVSWLYARALDLKLEGIVAKRADSQYTPGTRSADWIKLKRPGAVPPGRFQRKRNS